MRSAATLRVRPVIPLCVASLARRKGQDVLLRALARLRSFRWRLLLVGPAREADFLGRLRRLARRIASRQIVFTGAVSEARLARLYRLANLFVLPSYYEGYEIAVAEAAAHGLPVVASDAGAIPEAIASADTGWCRRAMSRHSRIRFRGFLGAPASHRWRLAGADRCAAEKLGRRRARVSGGARRLKCRS